jgi:hypothetical protein
MITGVPLRIVANTPRRQGKTRHGLMTAIAEEARRLWVDGLISERRLKQLADCHRMSNDELLQLRNELWAMGRDG